MPVEGLTDLQEAFVDALLRSPVLDRGVAHRKALAAVGRTPRANQNHNRAGLEMLRHPTVQAEIARRRARIEAASDAQVVQLEQRLARIALGDIRGIVDPKTGTERPLHELDDDTAAMLAGVETEDYVRGKGEDAERGTRRTYKLLDPLAATRLLMQRRGIGAERGEGGPSGGIVANIQINI